MADVIRSNLEGSGTMQTISGFLGGLTLAGSIAAIYFDQSAYGLVGQALPFALFLGAFAFLGAAMTFSRAAFDRGWAKGSDVSAREARKTRQVIEDAKALTAELREMRLRRERKGLA